MLWWFNFHGDLVTSVTASCWADPTASLFSHVHVDELSYPSPRCNLPVDLGCWANKQIDLISLASLESWATLHLRVIPSRKSCGTMSYVIDNRFFFRRNDIKPYEEFWTNSPWSIFLIIANFAFQWVISTSCDKSNGSFFCRVLTM